MNKSEVKRLLKEQAEPMKEAIRRKLEYLQSDDVFTEKGENAAKDDNSLMEAFSEVELNVVPSYTQPSARELYQLDQTTPQPQYASQPPTPQSIDEHKQNIAAKIAALRGISMPGDYLRKK
ncbi:MAG: hypothetical protein IJ677_02795 [Alphaproteobacteria bacterium]|nr:hypothetical protein [Alphaproteobacteria bacterium]